MLHEIFCECFDHMVIDYAALRPKQITRLMLDEVPVLDRKHFQTQSAPENELCEFRLEWGRNVSALPQAEGWF